MSNQPTPPTAFIVDAQLLDQVARYLLQRPMGEVEALMNGLRRSRAYVEPEPTAPEAPAKDPTAKH